mmetsp:Transcript_29031/g.68405  ORF Transcript_29031/g.68405 Transcript_29031/m.68405 type:complete len:102 (+) Transcript_29031:39-344(+)
MISAILLAAWTATAVGDHRCDTEPLAMLQMWEKTAQMQQAENELCQTLDSRCSKILDADACIEYARRCQVNARAELDQMAEDWIQKEPASEGESNLPVQES